MCGIWGFLSFNKGSSNHATDLYSSFNKLKARGPDRSDYKYINTFIDMYIGFHRLAIMDTSPIGDQPFQLNIRDENNDKNIYLLCNGEIYNYKLLKKEHPNYELKSESDCEILIHLYHEYGFEEMVKKLRGEFAIAVIEVDNKKDIVRVFISRDQTGVRPLFYGYDSEGFGFSSLLKGLSNELDRKTIRQLKCGEIINFTIDNKLNKSLIKSKFHSFNLPREFRTDIEQIKNDIRNTFKEAVRIRLDSHRKIGALLSGGLDSSLVVSVTNEYLQSEGNSEPLKTYSIGIQGSTDRPYAEMVSKHCGTDHTHIELSNDEFLDAIREVIRITETYDITTIRASVPQYLASKYIAEKYDIKVLLIGDGSDEVCMGYLYNHNAPTPMDAHNDSIRLVKNIQYYDSLRADRCIAGNGMEARVPFLDVEFVSLYLSIDPSLRIPRKKDDDQSGRRIEKWLLRSSFDCNNDNGKPYLPCDILWRKKEAFSDGVSSESKSWFEIINEKILTMNDLDDDNDNEISYHVKPHTREGRYYKKIFNQLFGYECATVIPNGYWMPKWSGDVKDPSARVLKVYKNNDE
jgi:asparagine synthase (glutamine-hydrolysing)